MPSSPARAWAVSDVHGHRDDLAAALRAAGLIDADDRWTGDDAELHVLGDLVDRGPDGIGVIRLLRDLQAQAPGRVHVLLGNHEVLMLAVWLFDEEDFALGWRRNGGVASDQAALSPADVAWLRGLPVLATAGADLLVHSDATTYLDWGRTVDDVNATVARLLASSDPAAYREVWRGLAQRRRFVGEDGAVRAKALATTYGAERVVHGHSIVATLRGTTPGHGPLLYAEGRALAIDGGRYNGGPLLLVDLAQTG